MSVADGLKQKRAELESRLSEIAKEQIELQKLVTALDLVIGSFDPDYQVGPAVRAALRTPPRNSKRLSDEAKDAIDGVNAADRSGGFTGSRGTDHNDRLRI